MNEIIKFLKMFIANKEIDLFQPGDVVTTSFFDPLIQTMVDAGIII